MSENIDTEQQASTNPPMTAPRVELLRDAALIISEDRNHTYGSPSENFERIAAIWEIITGHKFTREDVAMMFVGAKVARYGNRGTFQPDTWRDIAGYAGCGYEVGLADAD